MIRFHSRCSKTAKIIMFHRQKPFLRTSVIRQRTGYRIKKTGCNFNREREKKCQGVHHFFKRLFGKAQNEISGDRKTKGRRPPDRFRKSGRSERPVEMAERSGMYARSRQIEASKPGTPHPFKQLRIQYLGR